MLNKSEMNRHKNDAIAFKLYETFGPMGRIRKIGKGIKVRYVLLQGDVQPKKIEVEINPQDTRQFIVEGVKCDSPETACQEAQNKLDAIP